MESFNPATKNGWKISDILDCYYAYSQLPDKIMGSPGCVKCNAQLVEQPDNRFKTLFMVNGNEGSTNFFLIGHRFGLAISIFSRKSGAKVINSLLIFR